jgi:hypothetical protein
MAKNHDLTFLQSENFYFNFALRDAAGLPLDLTDGLVEWSIGDGSETLLLATSANGLIAITSEEAGLGYVNIPVDNHTDVVDGEYTHELRATLGNGNITSQVIGRLTVGASSFSVTPDPDTGTGFVRSSGLQLVYDTGTSDADPGDGNFRINGASFSAATFLYVDLADRFAVSITEWLAALDDSTTTDPYGYIRLTKIGLESTWYDYAISGTVISATGYRKIPVTYVAGAGAPSNGDFFAFTFSRTGDIGAQGPAGVGATLADADYGDIVVTSSGSIMSIDDGAVALPELGLTDPGADRVLFWDDSAGLFQHLEMGTNLSITGTTLNASATGATLADGDYGDIVVTSSGTVISIDAGVIVNADINASAAIDASKIADGSVSSTEFQYISTLSSNAQTQLDAKQPLDSDLTTIAGLTATTDSFMQAKSSAWAARTVAQVKTDLGLTGTNSGDQNLFSTIAVAGQSDVVADTATDTLTLAAGTNITITTNAGTDTVTIAASLTGATLGDGDYGDIVVSSSGTVLSFDSAVVTAAAKTVLDDASTAAMLTTLGAQPVDADLTTIAGLTATTDNFIVSVSSAWASRTPSQVRTTLGLGTSALMDEATAAQVRSATADKVITAELIESASADVALTDAATVAVDWDAGINFTVTLAGDRTLGNPTNGQPGTWRTITVTQDGSGNQTLAYDTQYRFAGGTEPVLTTTASAIDFLSIYCKSASLFYVFSALDMKA